MLLENLVGFLFPIMAIDNIADILAKFGDFESIVVGFCPTGNRSSFEPQTEELLHLCPLSRSSGRRVVRRPEMVSKDDDLMTFCPDAQDLCSGKSGNLLKEKTQ